MSKNLIKHLVVNAIETRCNSVQDDNFSDMKEEDIEEYGNNSSKICELERSIRKMLPPEGEEMYMELESLSCSNTAIESRYMFSKGVIEGLTTLKYLREVDGCVYLPMIKL